MSALVALGALLAIAGGHLRVAVISGGAAIATCLLLGTAAMPRALYPPGHDVDPIERVNVAAVLVFSMLPAVVLLLSVARTASATRDRRLAAVRVLGVSTSRTAAVAAVEAGLPTLMGALGGAVVFVALAPLVQNLVAAGPAWFSGPLSVSLGRMVLTVIGVTAVAVLAAALPVARMARRPLRRRSEATRGDVSRWRLLLVLATVGLLGWALLRAPQMTSENLQVPLVTLTAGAIMGALAVAFVTPLVTSWVAGLLTRAGSTAALLAGRAIQTEPAGVARLVSGIAVAVYLVTGASAVLAAYESTPQYRFAVQVMHAGPQTITLLPDTGAPPLTADQRADLARLDGVYAVVADYAGSCDTPGGCPGRVFVGSCADLAQVMTMTGCRDDRAAAVITGDVEDKEPPGWPLNESTNEIVLNASTSPVKVALGEPIVEHSADTQGRWVYPSGVMLFVPERVVVDAGAVPDRYVVVAAGGRDVQERLTARLPAGYSAWLYPEVDYEQVARVRSVVVTLSVLAIAVGLLGLAVATVDRAGEQRRTIARQIALGVPGSILRTSQLLQNLTPLLIAIGLAAVLGRLMVLAFAAVAGWPPLDGSINLAMITTATVLGALLVAISVQPVIQTRVTADLLRRE